jgi:hypothetical protein
MASRYAAAHARREQRRRQAATRDYLPLAEEHPLSASGGQYAGQSGDLGRSAGAATMTMRVPAIDYSYLRGDLLRTAVLAVLLFAIMIVLALVIHV